MVLTFYFYFVSDMLGEILSVSVLRLAEDSPPFVGYVCVCVCVYPYILYTYIYTHTLCAHVNVLYLYTHYIYVHNIYARTQRAVEHRV